MNCICMGCSLNVLIYKSNERRTAMKYEKPQVKKVEADVSVRNMADDKGECHGGHCVRCIHAFG